MNGFCVLSSLPKFYRWRAWVAAVETGGEPGLVSRGGDAVGVPRAGVLLVLRLTRFKTTHGRRVVAAVLPGRTGVSGCRRRPVASRGCRSRPVASRDCRSERWRASPRGGLGWICCEGARGETETRGRGAPRPGRRARCEGRGGCARSGEREKKLALRRRGGGSAWPGNMGHTALGRECAGMGLWHVHPPPLLGDISITTRDASRLPFSGAAARVGQRQRRR